MSDDKKFILILAGNYRQYESYCREKGLDPYRDAVFMREHVWQGARIAEGRRVGTWREQLASLQDEFMVALEINGAEVAEG